MQLEPLRCAALELDSELASVVRARRVLRVSGRWSLVASLPCRKRVRAKKHWLFATRLGSARVESSEKALPSPFFTQGALHCVARTLGRIALSVPVFSVARIDFKEQNARLARPAPKCCRVFAERLFLSWLVVCESTETETYAFGDGTRRASPAERHVRVDNVSRAASASSGLFKTHHKFS